MKSPGHALPWLAAATALALATLTAHADPGSDQNPPPGPAAPPPAQQAPPPADQGSPDLQNPGAGPDIGVSAGTRGLDLQLGYSFSPWFGVRLIGDNSDVALKTSRDDIDYKGHYDFRSLTLLGDWYPWGGSFHLSAGAVRNEDRIKATAQPDSNGVVLVNGEYPLAPGDQLNANGSYSHQYMPYAGIGWGNPGLHHQGIGFSLDLGAMYTQNPNVNLSLSGPDAGNPIAQAEVQQEQAKLNSDLHKVNVFPVANIGINYGF